MPDQNKSVKDIYDAGLEEVQRILFSLDSTPAQTKAARQTLKDLTAMSLANTLKTVEGRTAILAGLIVELSQITEKVKVNPPYLGAMKKLTSLTKTAQNLFTKEKKNLV